MSGKSEDDLFLDDKELEKMFELPELKLDDLILDDKDLEFDDPLAEIDNDYFAEKKEFDRYLAQKYNELEKQLTKKEFEINGLIKDFRKDLVKEVKKMMN